MIDRECPMRIVVFFAAIVLPLPPALAQGPAVGRTAQSSVGQIGQRQGRGQAAEVIQLPGPTNSRIQNRVQSRIRNRIDRSYDPQANAVSPFEVAGDQARRASRQRRR